MYLACVKNESTEETRVALYGKSKINNHVPILLTSMAALFCTQIASADSGSQTEYFTEIEISSRPLSSYGEDSYFVPYAIKEEDIVETTVESKKIKVEVAAVKEEVVEEHTPVKPGLVIETMTTEFPVIEDVPSEILEKSRAHFRNVFANDVKSSLLNNDFVGSLRLPEGNLTAYVDDMDDATGAYVDVKDEARLDGDKIYTFDNGKMVEVAKPDVIESKLAQNLTSDSKWTAKRVDSDTVVVEKQGAAPAAGPKQKPAMEIMKAEPVLALAKNDIPSATSSGLLSMDSAVSSQIGELKAYEASASRSGQGDDVHTSVHGQVVVPEGVDPRTVVIRVAGTSWQVSPDQNGFFEFAGIPTGSHTQLVLWDTNNVLARRMYSVYAAHLPLEEHNIEMQRTRLILDKANAFGVSQDITKSGFCATVTGISAVKSVGTQVRFVNVEAAPIYYFTSTGLPDNATRNLTESGKFCAFNLNQEIVDLEVVTPHGARRSFTVHLKPSTFENLTLDISTSIYRPVRTFELLDSSVGGRASIDSFQISFGDSKNKTWLEGQEGAVWAPVTDVSLLPDASFAPVELQDVETVYLPVGQPITEIKWKPSFKGEFGQFHLFAKEELFTKGVLSGDGKWQGQVLRDDKDPLSLKMIDVDVREDLARLADDKLISPDEGSAFVNVNLAALGVDYKDLGLSLRDVWTGAKVAEFNFLPSSAKNPRYLRGFFANIPQGQFSLVLSTRDGAIKWLDLVRSRAGQVQVLNIRD